MVPRYLNDATGGKCLRAQGMGSVQRKVVAIFLQVSDRERTRCSHGRLASAEPLPGAGFAATCSRARMYSSSVEHSRGFPCDCTGNRRGRTKNYKTELPPILTNGDPEAGDMFRTGTSSGSALGNPVNVTNMPRHTFQGYPKKHTTRVWNRAGWGHHCKGHTTDVSVECRTLDGTAD